jgi:hypothetical protein
VGAQLLLPLLQLQQHLAQVALLGVVLLLLLLVVRAS